MSSKICIDFKDFNEQCKKERKKPFILESVTIDLTSKEHFNESIKIWEDALKKWWQDKK